MTRVTPAGVATHHRGNTLDGVWVSSNIKVTKVTLKDGIREVTDHSMIELSLLLDKKVTRELPHKVDTFTTQEDIRRYQINIDRFAEELLEEDSLARPLRSII